MPLMDFDTSEYLEQLPETDPPQYKATIDGAAKETLENILAFDDDCYFAHKKHSVINHKDVEDALRN